MSKQTVTRSELLRRLRELRTLAAQYFELIEQRESRPVGSLFDPPTIGPSERTLVKQQIEELKPRLQRAEKGLLPGGFSCRVETIDFVIKAIDMRRATSIRQALNTVRGLVRAARRGRASGASHPRGAPQRRPHRVKRRDEPGDVGLPAELLTQNQGDT